MKKGLFYLFIAVLAIMLATSNPECSVAHDKTTILLQSNRTVTIESVRNLLLPAGGTVVEFDVPSGVREETITIKVDPPGNTSIQWFTLKPVDAGRGKLIISLAVQKETNSVIKVSYQTSSLTWNIVHNLDIERKQMVTRVKLSNNSSIEMSNVTIVAEELSRTLDNIVLSAGSSVWLPLTAALPISVQTENIAIVETLAKERSARPWRQETVQHGIRLINSGKDPIPSGTVVVLKNGESIGTSEITTPILSGEAIYLIAGQARDISVFSRMQSYETTTTKSNEALVIFTMEFSVRGEGGQTRYEPNTADMASRPCHIILPLGTSDWSITVDGARWTPYGQNNDAIDLVLMSPQPGATLSVRINGNLSYKNR